MTLVLKQSTAIDIRIGPFVDATDGVTPETGVSLGSADQAEVLKANGAATVAMGGTFAAVTGCDGWYDYTVAVGDVDTVGEVVFVVQDSSLCLPVFTRATVVEENVYVAWYAASAAAGTDLASILTDTNELQSDDIPGKIVTLDAVVDTVKVDTAAILVDTNELQTDDVPGLISTLSGKVDTVDGIVDAILVDTNELQTDDIPGKIVTLDAVVDTVKVDTAAILVDTNELQSDDIPGKLVTLDAVVDTVKAETVLILADTNELQSDDIPGLIAALNDVSTAEVNAEVDTALADIHLDHLFATDYDPASKPGTSTALLNEIVENDSGVSRFTVNALENGPSGSGASAGAIADAVWDEAQSGHTSADTFGALATEIATIDGKVDTIDDFLDTEIAAITAAVITNAAGADVAADIIALKAETAAILVDTNSTLQAELDAIQAAVITNAAGSDIAADIIAIKAETASILTDTSSTLDTKLNTIDSIVDDILVDTAAIAAITTAVITGAAGIHIAADIIALNDISAAEVNAEVDTAIETYHLDHLLAVDYDPASPPGVTTALLNEIVENDGGVSRFTTNALENGPSGGGGGGATAAAIADAVWDEASSDHDNAGSFGGILHPPGGLTRKL